MKKIVYVVGGLYSLTGMNSILTKKINWLAENTNYDMYMILTEKANLPWVFDISPKIKWVNFDLNFDDLDIMPLYKKLFYYAIKQRKYKNLFSQYLMEIKPDITVSALRREINFINDIHDGSKKVGEIHFIRSFYRNFYKSYLPNSVNVYISKLWMNSLIKKIQKLEKFVTLTMEDYENWPELTNKTVIPNFVPDYKGIPANLISNNAIAVGRYSWEKGFDLLIESWEIVAKKHPDWILNIYGVGNYQPLQDLANKKGLKDIVYCHPSTSDIYKKYQDSSIFILSSRHEGFGLVLLEAMSVGLPPVAFACPCGPRDIVTNKVDGLLAKNGDVQELANGICYFIEHPNERKEYGKKAIQKAKQFPQDKIMQKWIDLFESL